MRNKLAVVVLTAGRLGGTGAAVILGVTELCGAQTTTTPPSPADAAAG